MHIRRIFAWLLAAAVTIATLGPPNLRPHSSFGQDGEHALAFLVLGLAFGAAYPRHRLLISLLALAATGALEVLQLWMPGRHARWEDFIVDALAAGAGLAVATGLNRAVARSRRVNPGTSSTK